jgi:hypothetical protein
MEKTYTKRLDLQDIILPCQFTHIYPIRRAVNDHGHLEPCMTTKWKKQKLLSLLGTNQWKKQVTAFTGTN